MLAGDSLWDLICVDLSSGALGDLFEKSIEESFNLQSFKFMIYYENLEK